MTHPNTEDAPILVEEDEAIDTDSTMKIIRLFVSVTRQVSKVVAATFLPSCRNTPTPSSTLISTSSSKRMGRPEDVKGAGDKYDR
jgi:hypothetical protein